MGPGYWYCNDTLANKPRVNVNYITDGPSRSRRRQWLCALYGQEGAAHKQVIDRYTPSG